MTQQNEYMVGTRVCAYKGTSGTRYMSGTVMRLTEKTAVITQDGGGEVRITLATGREIGSGGAWTRGYWRPTTEDEIASERARIAAEQVENDAKHMAEEAKREEARQEILEQIGPALDAAMPFGNGMVFTFTLNGTEYTGLMTQVKRAERLTWGPGRDEWDVRIAMHHMDRHGDCLEQDSPHETIDRNKGETWQAIVVEYLRIWAR